MAIQNPAEFQYFLNKEAHGDARAARKWLECQYINLMNTKEPITDVVRKGYAELFRKNGKDDFANKLEGVAKYKTFDDFYKVIEGTNNINTADIKGGDDPRYNYMKQLLEKSGLTQKVLLSAPHTSQACTYARQGNIEIETMGHHSADDNTFSPTTYNNKSHNLQPRTSNSIATFVITPDFEVIEKFKAYDPDAKFKNRD